MIFFSGNISPLHGHYTHIAGYSYHIILYKLEKAWIPKMHTRGYLIDELVYFSK